MWHIRCSMNICFLPLHLFFLVPTEAASEYHLVPNKNIWKIYWDDYPASKPPRSLIYVTDSSLCYSNGPAFLDLGGSCDPTGPIIRPLSPGYSDWSTLNQSESFPGIFLTGVKKRKFSFPSSHTVIRIN